MSQIDKNHHDTPSLNQWINVFVVAFGTGLRGGEIAGLRWDDCDFSSGLIHVRQQVIYRKDEILGECKHFVTSLKTQSGTRDIPMISEVRDALLREKERQLYVGRNIQKIDGISGFVFRNKDGNCLIPHDINRTIERIVDKYNMQYVGTDKLKLEYFSSHQIRHSFCTRLIEADANIKVIQTIMGHSDIQTTLDIYADVTNEKKKLSMEQLAGQIVLL